MKLLYLFQILFQLKTNEFEPPGSEIVTIELQIKRETALVCNCCRAHKDGTSFCADIELIIDKKPHTNSLHIFFYI